MRYRYFSDLHLDHEAVCFKHPSVDNLWVPEPLASDADTVLLLAGDLWNGARPLSFKGESWLGRLATRFKHVVVVLGNHDYWGANLNTLTGKWRKLMAEQGLSNVTLLEIADGVEYGSVVLDGVRVVGGTLWTNLNRGDPRVLTKYDFEKGANGRSLWNDRSFIRATSAYHHFTGAHWLRQHRLSVANLQVALTQGDEPVLLLTHHAPCMMSATREGDPLADYLYASDLSDLILDHPRIKGAVHGHTHTPLDYLMGDVPVRCNPRGYAPRDLVRGFSPLGLGELG